MAMGCAAARIRVALARGVQDRGGRRRRGDAAAARNGHVHRCHKVWVGATRVAGLAVTSPHW